MPHWEIQGVSGRVYSVSRRSDDGVMTSPKSAARWWIIRWFECLSFLKTRSTWSYLGSRRFSADGLNTVIGAEVQRPLATVVIGGVISAMVMSLLVLRVLYMLVAAPRASRELDGGNEDSRTQEATASA